MNRLLTICLLVFSTCSFAQVPVSGIYDDFAIVTVFRNEQTKTITGNFNTCIGDGKICCVFNFSGQYNKLTDKHIPIAWSWPDDNSTNIKGEITCKSDTSFIIKLNELPPGSMACNDMDKDGYESVLVQKKNWQGLRMIKSRKAFFYSEPDDKKQKKAYVTMYDVIGITERKGQWIKAEYIRFSDSGKPVSTVGWIKLNDVFPTF